MTTAARTAVPVLQCPDCRAELGWEDVSEPTRTARCPVCRRVFDLTGGKRTGGGPARERPAALSKPEVVRRRARLTRPATVQVMEAPRHLVIDAPDSRRQLTVARAVAVLAAAGLGALAWWGQGLWAWGSLGAASLWVLLAGWLDRLRLEVRDRGLWLGRHPLWLPGSRAFGPGALRQLFVEERGFRGGAGDAARPYYALVGILAADGRRVDLVPEIFDVELALWLEQALESALRIPDAPVQGEIPRV